MPTELIHLIGSGGHARVVLDSLAALGVPAQSIAVFDQNPDRVGGKIGNHTIQALDADQLSRGSVHICIGDNRARANVAAALDEAGCTLRTIVDPRAIVSANATIGAGTFVAAGAIVATGARTGRCCILNHGAIVDHECVLSDFVHIAPGATLAGSVAIGQGTLIGAGANVLPGVSVASNATVGAGAVVIDDAADPAVYVGVPARKVERR